MKPDTKSFYEEAVTRAAERIIRGLDNALDLEALAKAAALSPFHFHRVFRGMVGETPLELHRRLRMERAASALLTRDVPVTTIAFDAGYETHESFTRAFRATYGCSPSEFRAAGRVVDDAGCTRPPQVNLAARSGIHFAPGEPRPRTFTFLSGPPMHVEITNQPELRTAAVHHLGPYARISEAFGRLGAVAGRAGLLGPDSLMIGIYHDDPEIVPEGELRSEAAVVVPPSAKIPNGLAEIVIPAGRYARTTHIGPYEALPDTWARLMGEWLPRSEHRVGEGVSYELYRNNPMNTKPSDLITEIYVPLQKNS